MSLYLFLFLGPVGTFGGNGDDGRMGTAEKRSQYLEFVRRRDITDVDHARSTHSPDLVFPAPAYPFL